MAANHTCSTMRLQRKDLGFSLSAAHAKAQEQLLLEGNSVLITPGAYYQQDMGLCVMLFTHIPKFQSTMCSLPCGGPAYLI